MSPAKRPPTIKLICSKHGEQGFDGFSHGAIHLACGCYWTDVGDKLKHGVDKKNDRPKMMMLRP